MKRLQFRAIGLAATLVANSCAAITDGTTQHILVSSEPAGASCRVFRSGVVIAQVGSTPASIEVRKSAQDLVIVCDKEGYQTASKIDKADVAAASVISSLLWGGTGWAVDSATGTANRYDDRASVVLTPAGRTSEQTSGPPAVEHAIYDGP